MYLGAQPSRQKSQSTRPGAYSALLSFLNITSGDFAGNCLTHPKHLKSPMHCARLTRVPCTMAAGSGTGWAGIEGSHRGLTASAQVGETPVRPPPGAPNRRSPRRLRVHRSWRFLHLRGAGGSLPCSPAVAAAAPTPPGDRRGGYDSPAGSCRRTFGAEHKLVPARTAAKLVRKA